MKPQKRVLSEEQIRLVLLEIIHIVTLLKKEGGQRTPIGFQSEGRELATAIHNTDLGGDHNHGGDNRPSFYTVIYIIKTK